MRIERGMPVVSEPVNVAAPLVDKPVETTQPTTPLVEAVVPAVPVGERTLRSFEETPITNAAVGHSIIAIGPYIVDAGETEIVVRHRGQEDKPTESGHVTLWTLSGSDGKLLVTAIFMPKIAQADEASSAQAVAPNASKDKADAVSEDERVVGSPIDKG